MNNQQPKPDPKGKAIASFVLGIIFGLPILLKFYGLMCFGPDLCLEIILDPLRDLLSFVLHPLFGLFVLTGVLAEIILGIKGLKSTKRKFAIAGIILSIIGLGYLLWYGSLLIYFAGKY